MLFNSLLYPVFLAVTVAVAWALLRMRSLRMAFLLVASYLFYMSWNPQFILLIVGSTLLDFFVGRAIEDTPPERARRRKSLLLVSLAGNLGVLGVFKYTNFFLQSFVDIGRLFDVDVPIPILAITLPVGISFYTFQTMSYTIDVYRGVLKAERNFGRFAVFVAFFPQLVAGPIVRATDLLPQLGRAPRLDRDQVGEALFRIARGLTKKVIIADFLALNLVDRAFSQPSLYSGAELMVALYAYTFQIYCDFSGYSDIAIGSARLLGYTLPENFVRPYVATSVAEFWRRWHLTLSQWLRYYVFFPLGGSRGGPWMAHRNTMITLILIGLWHGAAWKFVVYGALHGVAVSINRVLVRRKRLTEPGYYDRRQPFAQVLWKWMLTFHFVVLARILFRAPSFSAAAEIWNGLWTQGWGLGRITVSIWLVLGLAFVSHLTPSRWMARASVEFSRWPAVGQGAALAALAAVFATFAETDVVPFIYFQF